QDIIFRAVQTGKCSFRQQQIQPEIKEAKILFSCQQFIAKGQVMAQDSLLWLDQDQATGQTQLWRWREQRQELLLTFPADWRGASHLLYRLNKAYLLVQLGFSQSMLIELNLGSLIW